MTEPLQDGMFPDPVMDNPAALLAGVTLSWLLTWGHVGPRDIEAPWAWVALDGCEDACLPLLDTANLALGEPWCLARVSRVSAGCWLAGAEADAEAKLSWLRSWGPGAVHPGGWLACGPASDDLLGLLLDAARDDAPELAAAFGRQAGGEAA